MTGRTYGWDEKLAEGEAGEEVVLRWLARRVFPARVADVRKVRRMQDQDTDFIVGETHYEVKTDLLADASGNLFLELDALEKSRADIWLLYVPQRDWLFSFPRADLLAYALAKAPTKGRTVTTAHAGREWCVTGVPARISDLLLRVHGALYTQITKDTKDTETNDGGDA